MQTAGYNVFGMRVIGANNHHTFPLLQRTQTAYQAGALKRESKFKGHIFEVAVDEVLLPDGKTAGRELIFHKGAVAVLAVTPEGKIIIVKQ